MDNLQVDVTSKGLEPLEAVLKLFERSAAVGYRIDKGRFILYWSLPSTGEAIAFPFKMPMPELARFIGLWLEEADRGPEPNHDGHNSKGWRCYNERWGHIDGQWQTFAAVEPVWAMHGK